MQTNKPPRIASLPMKYVNLVAIFFFVSYLLRLVLILVGAQSLQGSGVPTDEATERAMALYLQDPQTVVVVNAWLGLAWLPIVWLIVVFHERRAFRWADLGLDWRRDSPRAVLVGALLAVGACLAYLLAGALVQGIVPMDGAVLATTSLGAAALTLAMFLVSGFGEGIAFRGYLQTRLLDRHAPIAAIAFGSVLYIPLYLLTPQLEPVSLASGLLLWFALGALYYLSKSLYLVGVLHALLSALPALLQLQVAPEASLVVHAVGAALALWALLRRPESARRPIPSPAR